MTSIFLKKFRTARLNSLLYWWLFFAHGLAVLHAEETVSFPNRGPSSRVGIYPQRYMILPDTVIGSAKQKLGNHPETWDVDARTNYMHLHKCVVTLGSPHGFAMYSITPTALYYLNAPESIPAINAVVGRVLKTENVRDEKKLYRYLACLFYLRCPQGVILDKTMTRDVLGGGGPLWLKGKEKSRQALLDLCHTTTVTEANGETTVSLNVLAFPGDVQKWTLHARNGKWFELTSMDIIEVRPKGTFSYPLLN